MLIPVVRCASDDAVNGDRRRDGFHPRWGPERHLLRRGALLFALILIALPAAAAGSADPFAFFRPSVVLSAEDRRHLARGESVARVVPSSGREIAVFAAVPVDIDGDRLVAWIRRIGALKKSAYVLSIGRFSDPPRLEDLADLALDDDELSELRACRPGDCDLKLAPADITTLLQAAATAGTEWKLALQEGFRRVILQHVTDYLARGQAALPPYGLHASDASSGNPFASLLAHSPFLGERMPRFAAHLRGFPSASEPNVESFIYWSKERLAGKAIVSATHVNILRSADRDLPDALTAGKLIFASHYLDASLGLTAVLRGAPGAPNYLAYLNRSDVDLLDGTFGGLIRWLMQRRLKSEAAEILMGLRQRLENGMPPPERSASR
jgi:hypothetical protein